jgi:hypothetical protein
MGDISSKHRINHLRPEEVAQRQDRRQTSRYTDKDVLKKAVKAILLNQKAKYRQGRHPTH